MLVYADDIEYGEIVLTGAIDWGPADLATFDSDLDIICKKLFADKPVYETQISIGGEWTHALIVKQALVSQYDLLIEFAQKNISLPDRMVCLAGSSQDFHGQRRRHWEAVEGNIHLSVYLTPNQKIDNFGAAFPILAAVSLVETIDSIPGLKGKAGIKWVNDVLIQNAKVAGFLVHVLSMQETITHAVLGIGLNVERTPDIQCDPYVPEVASLFRFVSDRSVCNRKTVLEKLLFRLGANFDLLCSGGYPKLFETYRNRSLAIGQNVNVRTDSKEGKTQEIASGLVTDIGPNLELFIAGHDKPVTKGRLILIE